MPLWALAVAGAAVMVAAAGQAVGPVLSGSVSGSAGLTVEQSVVLSSTPITVIDKYTLASNGLGVSNDEGTSFTAAIELHVGDTAILKLPVTNVSDAASNALLELNLPAGIDAEVHPSTGTTLKDAQMAKGQWLVWVNNGNSETLNITISPKDDLRPGFYTISGRITQITG